jgi:hypothetical protein
MIASLRSFSAALIAARTLHLPYYRQCPPEPGGQYAGGAPSNDEVMVGVASAVPTDSKPTIRNSILSARFMDCFSLCGSPGSGNPRWQGIIQGLVKSGESIHAGFSQHFEDQGVNLDSSLAASY